MEVVWKENSLTTPCRLVFDASQPTNSGFSLNDILTKGRNSINKLQEVFVLWTIHKSALHTDISKMYNTIRLRREHWVFQQYFWKNSLDPAKHCQEKVIKKMGFLQVEIRQREHWEWQQRLQETDTHRSLKSYQGTYSLMIVYLARIQRIRCST